MCSSTYSVVVKVHDGSPFEFSEKFTVTLDESQTIEQLKADWQKCKDKRRKEGWETEELVADMASLGYEFEYVNEWDEIVLNA